MNDNTEKCPNCGATMTKDFCIRCGYQKQLTPSTVSSEVSSSNTKNKGLIPFIIALINIIIAPGIIGGIFYFVIFLSIFDGFNREPSININMKLIMILFAIYIIISLLAVIKTYITCLKNSTKIRKTILIVIGIITFLYLFSICSLFISLTLKFRQ